MPRSKRAWLKLARSRVCNLHEILPLKGWAAGSYRLFASSAQVLKEWKEFVATRPDDARRCYERLSVAPLEPMGTRQFPLKGKANKPFWEYELSAGHRMHYGVKKHVVAISVGPHMKKGDGADTTDLITRRRAGFDTAETVVIDSV